MARAEDAYRGAPAHLRAGKAAGADDLIIQRRYRLVRNLTDTSGAVLLDFGCGNGAQTVLFAPHFRTTLGLDISERYLRELAANASKRGWSDRLAAVGFDGGNFPLADDAVDFAISFEVLEHVADEQKVLRELARVVRPGGTLAMSVPNRWWVFETHGANLPLLPWNRVPFFSWLPKRIHDRYARARIYGRGEIVGLLGAAGFRAIKTAYVTAPMDVVRSPRLQRLLRSTIFRGDETSIPFLSTAVLVVAERTGARP